MNKKLKAAWVKALRSGKYRQVRGMLHHKGHGNSYCCLGVLCDVAEKTTKFKADRDEYGRIVGGLLDDQPSRFGLRRYQRDKLVELNDKAKLSFKEIADHIQKNIKAA